MIRVRRAVAVCAGLVLLLVSARVAAAQQGSVNGTVVDPLGARIAGASVTLTGEGRSTDTKSDAEGAYSFANVAPGRYQVVATAAGFEVSSTDSIYVGATGTTTVDVTLQVGPLRQVVVVTAAAAEISQAQTGAPITVIDSTTLDTLNKPDVLEALRLVPGAQIVQTGSRGGTTSMFIRGGASQFNKVLIDGIVANDIGGGFDFAQVQTTGVEQVEVMRQTNSVVYGSDALAGVISITTRRGRTRTPEVTLSADGGNLGTWLTNAGIGGVAKRFDYYSSWSQFATDNEVPNNQYENGTYAGRFGVAVGGGTDISGTIRRTSTEFGSPNSISFFDVPDDSQQHTTLTYVGVTAQSQYTNRLQTTIRFGSTDQTSSFLNPNPSGMAYDPFGFGANYLGNVVTIRGNNGYTATGRAILDFGGTFPGLFESRMTRRALSGQATYEVNRSFSLTGGGRYEREEGYSDPDGDPTASRNNGNVFVEGRGAIRNRTYVNAGLGLEHNAVFGEAVVPRVSVASYLRQPTAEGLGETKLVLNAGTGIKAPSVAQAQSALFALVPASAGVEPIGPERSRSFDVGVEQGLAGSRARIRVAYFHNSFRDLIEFLNRTALVQAGVPPAAANATAFGAYINSQSYRAQGLELAFDAAPLPGFRLMASYTYLGAEVTEAFSASTSFNPAFPGIPIGAFSPLVGERPFRRPANSGTFMIAYTRDRADVSLSAYFAGTRDDSTFLSDQDFGNSLLLPNQDLAAPYQKVDLAGAYAVHPRLRVYTSIENLLNKDYEASFGFPALPLTARVGFRLTLGGDGGQRP